MDHLKLLGVSFEYLQMKRKSLIGRGEYGRLIYPKELQPLTKKNPHVLPQGKLVFAGGQNPPRLSLLQKFKKDTLPLSLLLSPLYTTNLYLSVQAFFDKPTPSTRYLSLFTSCFCTPQTPLSLSLSKHFFDKPILSSKKTIIPIKI